jgi:hypothetical protein
MATGNPMRSQQGGYRNPNRVSSGSMQVPTTPGLPTPNNPRQTGPLQGPTPAGEPGRPPSSPPLAVPTQPRPEGTRPNPNNPRGQ